MILLPLEVLFSSGHPLCMSHAYYTPLPYLIKIHAVFGTGNAMFDYPSLMLASISMIH